MFLHNIVLKTKIFLYNSFTFSKNEFLNLLRQTNYSLLLYQEAGLDVFLSICLIQSCQKRNIEFQLGR